LTAREFFKKVTETETASPYRPDAKLGIGDTYLGEGTAEALVLAINEFREFLSFYPTHGRADYAQYKLGMAHFRQMRHPQRDQTETREALKEFEAFVARYPSSSLLPEVKAKLREARDRLSDADYLVGYFYYRQRWYVGAVDRFQDVLKEDPAYTRRDAVYYYCAESLVKMKREAEALPLLEKLGGGHAVAASESTALPQVDHLCGAMIATDYLEPFAAPAVPAGIDAAEAAGDPDFGALGRIIAGDQERSSLGAGDFALIDRG